MSVQEGQCDEEEEREADHQFREQDPNNGLSLCPQQNHGRHRQSNLLIGSREPQIKRLLSSQAILHPVSLIIPPSTNQKRGQIRTHPVLHSKSRKHLKSTIWQGCCREATFRKPSIVAHAAESTRMPQNYSSGLTLSKERRRSPILPQKAETWKESEANNELAAQTKEYPDNDQFVKDPAIIYRKRHSLDGGSKVLEVPTECLKINKVKSNPSIKQTRSKEGSTIKKGLGHASSPVCYGTTATEARRSISADQTKEAAASGINHMKKNMKSSGIIAKKRPRSSFKRFPGKLHDMISYCEDVKISCVGWVDEGTAFSIFDLDAITAILPIFFGHSRYPSLQRQLSTWRFSRVLNSKSPTYSHPFFLKGRKSDCQLLSFSDFQAIDTRTIGIQKIFERQDEINMKRQSPEKLQVLREKKISSRSAQRPSSALEVNDGAEAGRSAMAHEKDIGSVARDDSQVLGRTGSSEPTSIAHEQSNNPEPVFTPGSSSLPTVAANFQAIMPLPQAVARESTSALRTLFASTLQGTFPSADLRSLVHPQSQSNLIKGLCAQKPTRPREILPESRLGHGGQSFSGNTQNPQMFRQRTALTRAGQDPTVYIQSNFGGVENTPNDDCFSLGSGSSVDVPLVQPDFAQVVLNPTLRFKGSPANRPADDPKVFHMERIFPEVLPEVCADEILASPSVVVAERPRFVNTATHSEKLLSCKESDDEDEDNFFNPDATDPTRGISEDSENIFFKYF